MPTPAAHNGGRKELSGLLDEAVDWRFKGFYATPGLTIGEVGRQHWRALEGGLDLPVMLLKESALEHNLVTMASYCAARDVDLAPHGKTTMSPQLVWRQVEAGAWGVSVATVGQARVFYQFGLKRILIVNQVLDEGEIAWLLRAKASDPELVVGALVDSVATVEVMDSAVRRELARDHLLGPAVPLSVLLELGYPGGRAGARTVEDALAVAHAVAASPTLRLAGVEGYEGFMPGANREQRAAGVGAWLGRVAATVDALRETGMLRSGLVEGGAPLVTAGGSTYFDQVVEALGGAWAAERGLRVMIRSGCYLTHDHGLYATSSPWAQATPERRLWPALEVWGRVLSRPEPHLAIVGFGRRDVPYDSGLPVPLWVRRDGTCHDGSGLVVTALNDQHAYVKLPESDEVPGPVTCGVGDLIGCGISHPCTAFDKWPLIPVVDDEYNVLGAVRTFF